MKPIPPERREAILAHLSWAACEKFAAVLHCASLSAHGLSEYCRRNGLYPEQIERWRLACEQANDTASAREAGLQKLQRGDRDRIRHLESELRRKEKALAEAAALLVLQKKARAVWGEEDA
jgi:hypothetical protein